MTEIAVTKTELTTDTFDPHKRHTFRPVGDTKPLTLTLYEIAHHVANATAKGHRATVEDCHRFLRLCESRLLNPYTGDAWMLGYDTNAGPTFTLITAFQALLRRAERAAEFDGMESGIVVELADGKGVDRRMGSIMTNGERVIGGWAKVYRTDRRVAHEAEVQFSTYDTGKSRWKIDPAGMIQKCAKAAAMREAFPNTIGQMYADEEMQRVVQDESLDGVVIDPPNLTAPATKERQPRLVETEVAHAEPVAAPPKAKATPKTKKKAVKAEPLVVDWAAEFTLYGVTEQAVLLRDSPTAADRESVMSAAKSMVANGEMKQTAFDCLGRYLTVLKTREVVA